MQQLCDLESRMFLWCSGYHACFTRMRSPVRTRVGTSLPLGSISGFCVEIPFLLEPVRHRKMSRSTKGGHGEVSTCIRISTSPKGSTSLLLQVCRDMESIAAKDGTNHSEGADDDDDSFARDRGGASIALPSAADHGDIAKDENQTVRRNKCIVYTVLSIAAILFAVFVFVFIRNNEIKAFEKAFYANGPIVFKAIGSSLDRTLIHLDIATTNIISYAKAVNATWPFVTFPDFALVMSKVLPQTDGMIIQLVPIVQPQERDQWEWYTSQNNQWVNDSITLLDNWDEYYYGSINYDWEAHDVIHGDLDDIPRNVRYAKNTKNSK